MHLRRAQALATWAPPAALVWGTAASFYLVALFHRMSLGVAAIDAEERFGVSAGMLGAFSAVQLGLYLLMQIPAGLAADRIGPRRTLALGLALMAAGETVFALGTSVPAAFLGRGLIGVGDAFIFLNVLRLAQSWYPASRYGLLATLAGLAGAAGQVVTTVPLGASLAGLGWTPTFLGGALLTLVMLGLCLLVVRDAPGRGAGRAVPHEPLGATLRGAWRTPATRQAMWMHTVLMGTFVTVTALWGYPFLVRAEGLAPGDARTLLMAGVVAFGLGGPVVGAHVARAPRRREATLLAIAALVTVAWAATLASPGPAPAWLLTLTFLVTGVGGATGLLAFDVARSGNPAHRGGAASGIVNIGGFGAAVTSQLTIAAVLQATGAGLGVALWPMVAAAACAA